MAPGTSSSEPGRAARRTRTRRPGTSAANEARPDTAVSGITDEDLPDQTFWREDDGFDEEEEFEESEDEDPFAFARPKTARPGTAATGTTDVTPSLMTDDVSSPATTDAARVPELAYGQPKGNMNNQSFAYSMSTRRTFEDTAYTASEASYEPKRQRSKAPLIPSTAGTGWTGSTDITSSSVSRRSIGMTEMTGDMTVPEGKTTYGDGQGGLKDVSEQGEDVLPADYMMEEEDSPYPEVRASVSNIDDQDMPCKSYLDALM